MCCGLIQHDVTLRGLIQHYVLYVCVRGESERGEAAHAQQLPSLTADPVQHSRFQTHRSAAFSIALPHPDIHTGGNTLIKNKPSNMSVGNDFGNPLRKFKLVFLGEQSGECHIEIAKGSFSKKHYYWLFTGVCITCLTWTWWRNCIKHQIHRPVDLICYEIDIFNLIKVYFFGKIITQLLN